MAFINPFSEIDESGQSPFAHMLRTNFLDKLSATYYSYTGNNFVFRTDKAHVGLFDFFTFAIPLYLAKSLFWCMDNCNKNAVAALLLLPAIAINLFFVPLRYLTGLLFVIVMFPLVLGIHLFSLGFSMPRINYLNKLTTIDGQTFEQALEQNDLTLEQVEIDFFIDSNDPILVVNKARYKNSTATSMGCECCANGGFHNAKKGIFRVNLKEKMNNQEEFEDAVNAAFDLNIGDISSKMYDRKGIDKHTFFSALKDFNSKADTSAINSSVNVLEKSVTSEWSYVSMGLALNSL